MEQEVDRRFVPANTPAAERMGLKTATPAEEEREARARERRLEKARKVKAENVAKRHAPEDQAARRLIDNPQTHREDRRKLTFIQQVLEDGTADSPDLLMQVRREILRRYERARERA